MSIQVTEEPIAVRTLHLEGDRSKTFRVEIYRPVLVDGVWRCLFVIEGAPENIGRVSTAGSDSYQALRMAMEGLPSFVEMFNKQFMNSKLRLHPGEEDLGFDLKLFKK